VSLAPDSAVFWRDLARFSLNDGRPFIRFRAEGYITRGLKAATKTGDTVALSELSDERGMILWKRYESDAKQGITDTKTHGVEQSNGIELTGQGVTQMYSKEQAKNGVKQARDILVEQSRSLVLPTTRKPRRCLRAQSNRIR